jgi:hypothetical protein
MNDISNPNCIWQVESLRFTLFYSAVDKQSAEGLWEKITGSLPQNRTERPQERLLVEEGIWEDNLLSVTLRPDRIDVIISSAPTIIPELPNAGQLEAVISRAQNLLDKLQFSEVTRIAFGLVLLHPERDHSSAYQTLTKFLPNVQIEPGARELVYQINLPIKSKNDSSIEINRLRRWSVALMRFINVLNAENSNRVELFATRLELDINTHQDFTLSELSKARKLMDELIAEAIAITQGENHD